MAKLLPPIDPATQWKERHAHHYLHLVEDKDGRVWLQVEDLKQWIPGFDSAEALHRKHPGTVRCVPPSKVAFVEAQAFLRITAQNTNVPALKLRSWLQTTVLEPVRRRQQGRTYAAGFGPRLPSSLLSADEIPHSESDGQFALRQSQLRQVLDPRLWQIATGRWGLTKTMVSGFAGALAAVAVSGLLNDQAWDVNNHYLFWTWIALLAAMWAVSFNVAWAVGAVRGGLQRVSDLFNPWVTTLLVTLNLIAAAYTAGITLQNSSYLVHLWWKAYVVGDPPALVQITDRSASGQVRELTLSGGLGIGSTAALREALADYPEATRLVLSSPGGLVIEGFGLADVVAASNVETTVVRDQCSSACTLPFLTAPQRVVGADGVIGFHRSYSLLGDYGQGWSPVEHLMADLMRESGVTESFVQRALSTPGWEMYEAALEELIANGVATGTE